ncbi:hypothetical protein [Nocardia sp. CA-290969]|uniref:hypothetical protein n=1 Tax=Nocardia sp. CA-290969 TaxID=3239986 RepID=UPI003D8AD0D0
MGAQAFEFDKMGFLIAAGAVDRLAEAIDEVGKTLQAAMDNYHGAWGNDQIGDTFYNGVGDEGGGYAENSAHLMEGIRATAESATGLAAGMRYSVVPEAQGMDESNGAGFGG